YAVVVGVIALAHIILVIVYFSKKDLFLTAVYDSMDDMTKNYKSIESGEVESVTFGLLMSMLECCGFNDANDFTAAGSQFTREDSYNGVQFASELLFSKTFQIQNVSRHIVLIFSSITDIQYPVPCCKTGSVGQNGDDCPQTFTVANSNIRTGCKQKIYERAVPLLDSVMLGSLVVLGVE
ncbi:hypothetical protein T265_15272, partial [Opisthorchis viverrini]